MGVRMIRNDTGNERGIPFPAPFFAITPDLFNGHGFRINVIAHGSGVDRIPSDSQIFISFLGTVGAIVK